MSDTFGFLDTREIGEHKKLENIMNINPELLAAFERNQKWIVKKCRISEKNYAKCQELIQEVYFNILDSNKNFTDKTLINTDAWVKKITTNVIPQDTQQLLVPLVQGKRFVLIFLLRML